MTDSPKVRETRLKRLLGLVLLSELVTGKRNLLNVMLDKGTTMESDRKELELPPLPRNAWQGLNLNSQLRKARLESAIMKLSEDRTVNPNKQLIYRDHVYSADRKTANQKNS
ncbi:hypothetical protein [Oceanospirillum beijerinckii]|uniref:hypothetical protein n=1 Tax=Oceanospirillum beijerinckii TaxID=64976 RepID=UPI0003F970CF|nr:hypothetical protein [Oceanospirillum beijerinckii]MAC45434.1 hypothetical protein [Oceanospirillum sp.]